MTRAPDRSEGARVPRQAAQSCWPLRSLLFVPAHRVDWVRKTALSSVDAAILDLEDAVPRGQKGAARALLGEEIGVLSQQGIAALVRLNALGDECEADIEASVRDGLAGVMLPKTDSAEDVRQLHALLDAAEEKAGLAQGSVGVIPLPETAKGLWRAHEIAAASPRVTGLITAVSGPVSGDVSRAFGFQPTSGGEEQLFLQSRTILASRAAGANYPIGTIMGTRLDDLEFVERLTRRAKQLGFSGVALIHPSHLAIANAVFRPSEDEIAYSIGLIEALSAAEARGDGAASYHGTMVDAAMLPAAREIIAAAERYRMRDQRNRPLDH